MYKGKISINRFNSNTEPHHGISIEIEDENSGINVVHIELSPEQFGNAVSGLGATDCLFDVNEKMELIGMRRENKTQVIRVEKSPYEYSESEIISLLSKYEVDGWTARIYDFKNHHRYNHKEGSVSVTFTRFVK